MKEHNLQELYEEYATHIKMGNSASQALARFSYLHPISLAQLEKYVKEKCGTSDKECATLINASEEDCA